MSYPLLPLPVSVTFTTGAFDLTPQTGLLSDPACAGVADWLRDVLGSSTGFALPPNAGASNRVELIVDGQLRAGSGGSTEGYHLSVTPAAARVAAPSAAGVFYGLQTLRQLMPEAAFAPTPTPGVARWAVPCCEVVDFPRFGWRGLMLDCARHFMPVEFLRKLVDLLAVHKMNTLHLHLTDDQGWRFEVRRYPRLTEVGAWRRETLVGHLDDRPPRYDGTPHGGFYTQAELRDLVRYAAGRFVTIVPEIEMPGHAQAAIAAYPHLGNHPDRPLDVLTRWGVNPNIFNAEESTIGFLQDVLAEVLDVFPSPFVHVGGDEAVKDQWDAGPRVQARVRELGLRDAHELQSYFIRRMDAFLGARGRRLVGWDEILEGGLAPGATVMSWRGEAGGIAAARAGHDVVMTPTSHTYFDYYQHQDTARELLAIGGCLPLDKVYGYDPVPADLTAEQARHVLGSQGQLWTEYIRTPAQAEYMAFPRTCALAEVVWTPPAARDWPGFVDRLRPHLGRLSALGTVHRVVP